jgi:serine/threonine-protein kinase
VDRLLQRNVALKIFHQPWDDKMMREPRVMVPLKHPNIVDLITVEESEGAYFMVMEYVDGESLDKQIRQERHIQPQRALEIAIGLCTAIAFAHSHKIIHRDLRPANILMTKDGIPKVSDFGTSRVLELQDENYACTRIGSPPYMSPEHFRGRAVFQSDIWSLGITIYEMLTGTVPFYDTNAVKIAQAFLTQPIVAPHLRNAQVPKVLSQVVMKALSINLGDRYISAQEMLNALLSQRETVLRETRPILPSIVPPTQPGRGQTGKQSMCRFCYQPLPRMATTCPRCGEKV